MISGQTFFAYCIMSIFVVAIPFSHRGLNIFVFFLITDALTCCRVVALSHCYKAKQLSRARLCVKLLWKSGRKAICTHYELFWGGRGFLGIFYKLIMCNIFLLSLFFQVQEKSLPFVKFYFISLVSASSFAYLFISSEINTVSFNLCLCQ